MKAAELLTFHNLKRTACREGIIEVIMSASEALSESEIKAHLSERFDRTTFYRSFKTLEEQGLIHKIVVDNQLVKYAIDLPAETNQQHAHFYCNECNQVKCLDSIPVQRYELPDGYASSETEVLIKGTCETCSN